MLKGTLLTLLLFHCSVNAFSKETDSHQELKEFITTTHSKKCPSSLLEWKERREALRKSTLMNDVVAFGVLLKYCSTKEDQNSFFKNEEFKSCTKDLNSFTELVTNSAEYRAKIAALNTHPNIAESSYQLPPALQDVELHEAIQNGDEKKITEALGKIYKENPDSVTFKYLSRLGEGTHAGSQHDIFYITHYPTQMGEKTVHYDAFGTIIMMNKIKKGADGKDLPRPVEVMGIVDRKIPDAGTKQTIAEAKLQLASELKQNVQLDGLTLQCAGCHQGALLIPIVPFDDKATKSYVPTHKNTEVVEWFNENKVKARKNPAYVAVHSFLPPFGDPDASIDQKFIEQCSKIKNVASTQKILNAMSCSSCHDGTDTDPLLFPFNPLGSTFDQDKATPDSFSVTVSNLLEPGKAIQFEKMVIDVVLSTGQMPPNANKSKHKDALSPVERKALEDCLLIEYFGNLYSVTKKRGFNREGRLLTKLLAVPCPVK